MPQSLDHWVIQVQIDAVLIFILRQKNPIAFIPTGTGNVGQSSSSNETNFSAKHLDMNCRTSTGRGP